MNSDVIPRMLMAFACHIRDMNRDGRNVMAEMTGIARKMRWGSLAWSYMFWLYIDHNQYLILLIALFYLILEPLN